ncbi:uridine/cytidine kinase [Alphaproteobacteria bacterium]
MPQNMLIVGVSGASAAGKTLLTTTIVNEIGSDQIAVISEDSYYKDFSHLPLSVRTKVNFDHPNAFDHESLVKHLNALRNGEQVEVPIYNYDNEKEHMKKRETRTVKPHKILILEGILLFTDPDVRSLIDIKIYVDTPLDVCLIRRIRRDTRERSSVIEGVLEQYEKTVRPMFKEFIEPSKQHADLIIPNTNKNHIAIDLVKTKMQHILYDFHSVTQTK